MKLDPPPDFHGAAIGSIDFIIPTEGTEEEATFPNSGRFLQETIRIVYGRGSSIEFEVSGVTGLHRLRRYLLQEEVVNFLRPISGWSFHFFLASVLISPSCSSTRKCNGCSQTHGDQRVGRSL
jgi:hypothetical protein